MSHGEVRIYVSIMDYMYNDEVSNILIYKVGKNFLGIYVFINVLFL